MIKEMDIGQGFTLNKKGIFKDGKTIFTADQLTALVLYHDITKAIRENAMSQNYGKFFDDIFGSNSNDN